VSRTKLTASALELMCPDCGVRAGRCCKAAGGRRARETNGKGACIAFCCPGRLRAARRDGEAHP